MADESSKGTKFQALADNKQYRLIFTGVLCVLYFINLVLAGVSIHVYPSSVDGALAFQVVLSIATFAYSAAFVWRTLEGCSKKRTRAYLAGNALILVFWAAGFLALVIELSRANSAASQSNSDNSNNGSNSGNQGTQGSRRRLAVRDSASSSSSSPAVGCIILDLVIMGAFLMNFAYLYLSMKKLFPTYAEVPDDAQAFNAEMTEGDTHEGAHDEEAAHGAAANGYASYGSYEGQSEYKPGGQYDGRDSPAQRYNVTPPSASPHRPPYGNQGQMAYGQGTPPDASPHRPPYGNQGPTPYSQEPPSYAVAGAHQDTSYHSQLSHSPPHPGTRFNPAPYPRDSAPGYHDPIG